MERKALKGNGHILFGDKLTDGDGLPVGRDFFQNFSEECYNNLAKYWHSMDGEDHLFTYSERQSLSYIMPALFSITDGAAVCEMPLTRQKKADPDNTGFLDYWAYYDGMPIVIEAKHSWYNLA